MTRWRASRARQLGEAVQELLQGIGVERKLREYEAVVRWETIVGAQIAREAEAVRIQKGVLHVRVRSSVWRNELTMQKAEIRKKLNEALGEDLVKDIRFQ